MLSEEYAQCNFLWFVGFHKCIYDGIFIEKVPVRAMQALVGMPSEEALQAKMSCRRRRLMQRYPRLNVYEKEL